jgi:predicted phosphate transport protein (TIGR00153 family)
VAALSESPLSRLFGRAPAYGELYGLVREAGQNVQRSTALLSRLLSRWPDEDGERHDLVDCEHEGDRITHDIIHHLYKRSATPFDRADLLALASRVDDVVDYAEEVADYLFLYKVEAPMEQAVALAGVLERAGAELAAALDRIDRVEELPPHVVEIGRLEDEGDRIERECLTALFGGGIDPMLIIRWKDIVERLEQGVDSCDHVGHVLEGIVVKHA